MSASEVHASVKRASRAGLLAEPGAPICRRVVAGVRVDVMPTDGSVLGYTNHRYPQALANAISVEVQGERFRIVDAPQFCATKLDSFADRGFADDGERNWYHHDVEDIVALVDGREKLLVEIAGAAADVRRIAEQVQGLLETPAFMEAPPGHLPGDSASQGAFRSFWSACAR